MIDLGLFVVLEAGELGDCFGRFWIVARCYRFLSLRVVLGTLGGLVVFCGRGWLFFFQGMVITGLGSTAFLEFFSHPSVSWYFSFIAGLPRVERRLVYCELAEVGLIFA